VRRQRRERRKALFVALAAAVILLSLTGGFLWLLGGPAAVVTKQVIGGPFRLIASDGRAVTDRDFRGKYLLIYFGYTSCPDVCPTALNDVASALDRLGAKADHVQPLFVSVDPNDTPRVVAKYVAAFTPHLVGLTGSPDDVAAMEREYHVSAAMVRAGTNDYSIDHSAVYYLIGPDGRFIAALRAEQGGEALATDIDQHLSRN
jgi:protein SCO1/2